MKMDITELVNRGKLYYIGVLISQQGVKAVENVDVSKFDDLDLGVRTLTQICFTYRFPLELILAKCPDHTFMIFYETVMCYAGSHRPLNKRFIDLCKQHSIDVNTLPIYHLKNDLCIKKLLDNGDITMKSYISGAIGASIDLKNALPAELLQRDDISLDEIIGIIKAEVGSKRSEIVVTDSDDCFDDAYNEYRLKYLRKCELYADSLKK